MYVHISQQGDVWTCVSGKRRDLLLSILQYSTKTILPFELALDKEAQLNGEYEQVLERIDTL